MSSRKKKENNNNKTYHMSVIQSMRTKSQVFMKKKKTNRTMNDKKNDLKCYKALT